MHSIGYTSWQLWNIGAHEGLVLPIYVYYMVCAWWHPRLYSHARLCTCICKNFWSILGVNFDNNTAFTTEYMASHLITHIHRGKMHASVHAHVCLCVQVKLVTVGLQTVESCEDGERTPVMALFHASLTPLHRYLWCTHSIVSTLYSGDISIV